MLSDQDIELAHPEAFDFVFGNLPRHRRADFNRHLSGCRYCQSVVDEYADVGQMVRNLPPHAEPSADLEDQTVAAMVAAMADQKATTARQPDAEDQVVTRLYPVPGRVAGWRRHRGRLTAIAAVAAAVIAAVAVPLGLSLGHTPAGATVVIPLHATTAAKVSGFAAVTGQATARQDASGSWDITLTVHHLKNFGDAKWYQCWYLSTQRGQVASAGTFLVPDSGTGTFSMTSAVDPHDFSVMEITVGPPNRDGALAGTVLLSGRTL